MKQKRRAQPLQLQQLAGDGCVGDSASGDHHVESDDSARPVNETMPALAEATEAGGVVLAGSAHVPRSQSDFATPPSQSTELVRPTRPVPFFITYASRADSSQQNENSGHFVNVSRVFMVGTQLHAPGGNINIYRKSPRPPSRHGSIDGVHGTDGGN